MFDQYPNLEFAIAIVHGIFLAIGLIVPLGVQNIFIFNQGASNSRFINCMPSVITASICDTILILLAVCGVSLIVMQIAALKLLLFIGGFIFLVYMGYHSWNSASKLDSSNNSHALSPRKQILFAISTSILNPHAIIDTVAVIGTNSLEYVDNAKIAFTMSCIIISWIWFISIAFVGHLIQKLPNKNTWIARANKFAAILMWIIAFYIAMQIIDDINDLLHTTNLG